MGLSTDKRKQYDKDRLQRLMADPVRHARLLELRRAAREARIRRSTALPEGVSADLLRTYGPFAPLFILQQAAA